MQSLGDRLVIRPWRKWQLAAMVLLIILILFTGSVSAIVNSSVSLYITGNGTTTIDSSLNAIPITITGGVTNSEEVFSCKDLLYAATDLCGVAGSGTAVRRERR
jgi:hypothetical protein